ncbi:MAG: glutathione S-transferase N-terminal domain-containing protein [Candidatus Nanohaloarchaeota archaeon QJJ-5]|nr:glutathione S-transferase N-terminal domain-containing protein [Candidatus Nanohaloarchaeota archaeon QJJ-5]
MSDVEIYTTPTCPHCENAKEFFQEHDVEYTEHNVADDEDKAKEMIEMTGQRGVPVIVVDGEDEPIIGFNRDKVADALGIEA